MSKKNIIDITNSTCIPHLLNSKATNCTKINNQHIPSFEEITPGILFLNQYTGSIEVDEEVVPLDGSYVIHFHNTSLKVQNHIYKSIEMSAYKPLPPVLQPIPIRKNTEELLSLEMMKELHGKNSKYIDLLETRNKHNTTAVIIVTILFIALAIFCLIKLKKNIQSTAAEITTTDATTMIDLATNENPTPVPRIIGIEDISKHLKSVTSNEGVRF